MNITTYTPAEALQAADARGCITIADGVWLHSQESVIEEQEGWDEEDDAKGVDFTTAPYWITTDSGTAPIAVYGADDEDLTQALANA